MSDARLGRWTVRAGAPSDTRSALALWRVAGGQPSATDTEGALETLLNRDAGALLVAQAGDDVVETLIVGWDG